MTGRGRGRAGRWELTPQQAAAVDLLATGRTVSETAEAVGVVRQTVSEWLNRHHGFRAELNRRREELWDGMQDRLRALLPKALDVIAGELDSERALAAAVHVLRACGLYGIAAPFGPTTSEELELKEREAEGERRRRARYAPLGE
jgi:Homeodomain-like domain-containing protein